MESYDDYLGVESLCGPRRLPGSWRQAWVGAQYRRNDASALIEKSCNGNPLGQTAGPIGNLTVRVLNCDGQVI